METSEEKNKEEDLIQQQRKKPWEFTINGKKTLGLHHQQEETMGIHHQ